MARAASQSTIHPLDTMKVRLQAGRYGGELGERVCKEKMLPEHAEI
jgi:hypothetical protein